jgi:hypothetical protein
MQIRFHEFFRWLNYSQEERGGHRYRIHCSSQKCSSLLSLVSYLLVRHSCFYFQVIWNHMVLGIDVDGLSWRCRGT